MLVDLDVLWPGFSLEEHPAIVVDSRDPRRSSAYCIGHCEPRLAKGGISRLWLATSAHLVPPGNVRFDPLEDWGLRGEGKIVALGFQRREQAATVLIHEHFHLHYQPKYVQSFGDEMKGDSSPSLLNRSDLENSYSTAEPVSSQLRNECSALVDALRVGSSDRRSAIEALRRFVAVRESRRARLGAPSFMEDFWEREEGVPVNLERRLARQMEFADPSLIGSALEDGGCQIIPGAAYFLVLGGLQGAVLDELGDASVWPNRVYPRDGTPAVPLYTLIRELLSASERGDS